MKVAEYLLYCLAVVIMIATPGPVMMLVASAGLKGGYAQAFKTITGTNLASLVLITLSVLIIKGAVHINEQWLSTVQILGSSYIAWLGIQIIREARTEVHPAVGDVQSTDGGFVQGFMVGISNPKDIIFFASFFPQFIHITSDLNISLMILTFSWIVLDFATLSVVYLGFNKLSGSSIYRYLLLACGCILMAVAVFGLYSGLKNF
ncbi:LysE family translocator [Acinetobacter chinensis]|uniref:LysE family translocator n=1 Tax=Acinetobacter chinensis TaxID=2004650 RepID=A0ABU3WI56_9GAMM|nr:LysE family translocator [Acinetobacter chinensis]MDV2470075.1 LysE family translocator [Acinetobacter chinensis]